MVVGAIESPARGRHVFAFFGCSAQRKPLLETWQTT